MNKQTKGAEWEAYMKQYAENLKNYNNAKEEVANSLAAFLEANDYQVEVTKTVGAQNFIGHYISVIDLKFDFTSFRITNKPEQIKDIFEIDRAGSNSGHTVRLYHTLLGHQLQTKKKYRIKFNVDLLDRALKDSYKL